MNKQVNHTLTTLFRIAAALLLVFSVGCWFYFNICRQYVLDWDAAKVYYHTVHMWENKTVAIPYWVYETTGEWDCSSLPAMLLYGLTGNILLSFGIANCLNVLLFCLTGFLIFRKTHVGTGVGCLVLAFILLPFGWGMLDYSNMLFYGAGQYFYKVLVPLLLIALYEDDERKLPVFPKALLILILLVLTLAVSSASGVYVLACGIAPVLLCRAVELLRRDLKGVKISNLALTVLVCAAAVGGVILHKELHLETPTDGVSLATVSGLLPNLKNAFEDILRVLEALPNEYATAFSVQSLAYLMKFFLFALVFAGGLSRIGSAFVLNRAFGNQKEEEGSLAEAMLVSVFLWNFAVCVLSMSTERYQLLGLIPLVLASGAAAEKLSQRASDTLRHVCLYALCGLLFCLSAYLWREALYAVDEHHSDVSRWIIEAADEQDVGTVVFLNNSSTEEETRAMDLRHKYVTYGSGLNIYWIIDDYYEKQDRSFYDDRHLLVVSEGDSLDSLAEHLRRCNYTFVEDLGNGYLLYVSERNRMDGTTGPAKSAGLSIDFPHSHAYHTSDTYDEDGLLALSGGFMNSPEFTAGAKGTHVRLVLKDLTGSPTLSVTENGVQRILNLAHCEAAFDVEPSAAFSFVLTAGPEDTVTVDRIEFTNN